MAIQNRVTQRTPPIDGTIPKESSNSWHDMATTERTVTMHLDVPWDERPGATKVRIIDKGALVTTPGPLSGKDLEAEQQARRLRGHFVQRERYRRWRAGDPEEPELARWHANDEI